MHPKLVRCAPSDLHSREMQLRLIETSTKVSELSVQLQNYMHTSSRGAGNGFVEVQLGKGFFIE